MTHKKLKILTGLNEGAEIELNSGVPIILGSHQDCTLVLIDNNIADRHCQFILTVAGLMCTALNGDVVIGDKTLSPGETLKIDDVVPIKCGDITLAAGDKNVDWDDIELSNPTNATEYQLQNNNKIQEQKRHINIGVVATLIVVLAGIAYTILKPSSSKITQSYLNEARVWLKTIAPAGSELQINQVKDNQLVLSGYVVSNYQNELLLMTVHNSVFHPKIEVYSIEQMLASMSRLANLEGISCVVAYRNNGHLACTNKIDNAEHEQRLQVLAQQIVGVKGLETRGPDAAPAKEMLAATTKDPEPVTAATPVESTNTITHFARKLFILMSKRGRYVIDSNGYKFTEGDVIDGFTLTSIELDQVKLERNGQRYLVSIGAMR